MKRLSAHIILLILLITCGSLCSYAQTRSGIDTDIHSIRDCIIPDFHSEFDDYLQYAPAALTVGLKATGYQSRTSWGRMLTSDALSVAVMAAGVNGIKYSIKRMRPDGSRHNSFPSGHTATAFLSAAMLHKEYGWRSPWFSIGGYTAAAVTGVSRIMNNKHWFSDVAAGAAIGIGSVHLGYFLGDLIFKEKGINQNYIKPEFSYDPTVRHYVAEVLFGQRFIIGAEGMKDMETLPVRGGIAGISTDIPIIPGTGITMRGSASAMTYKSGTVRPLYSILGGAYWNYCFARRFEFQAHAMAGYAWNSSNLEAGADLAAGISLSIMTDSNFKLKAFTDFETISLSPTRPWVNSIVLGCSSAWFW